MSNPEPSPEEIEQRKRWFHNYIDTIENHSVIQPPSQGIVYRCPCCGCRTLSERGGDEICPVCFWEDDGQDNTDADTVRGGPNGALSLTKARQNFREFGAYDRKSLQRVRKPTPEEL
jgi:Cysteine-rich CPCC